MRGTGRPSSRPTRSSAPRRSSPAAGRATPPAARLGAVRQLGGLRAHVRLGRWPAVFIIVAGLMVGFPVVHAFLGETASVLLATLIAGFGLGRATASKR